MSRDRDGSPGRGQAGVRSTTRGNAKSFRSLLMRWRFVVLFLVCPPYVSPMRPTSTGRASHLIPYIARISTAAAAALKRLWHSPQPGGGPQGIAVDPAGGKMYWTHSALNTIYGANDDGSPCCRSSKSTSGPRCNRVF